VIAGEPVGPPQASCGIARQHYEGSLPVAAKFPCRLQKSQRDPRKLFWPVGAINYARHIRVVGLDRHPLETACPREQFVGKRDAGNLRSQRLAIHLRQMAAGFRDEGAIDRDNRGTGCPTAAAGTVDTDNGSAHGDLLAESWPSTLIQVRALWRLDAYPEPYRIRPVWGAVA
jgi:hypothetical protein